MVDFNPLPVEPTFFSWRNQNIASYNAGSGRKILLLHSINAAASAFEMRKPFAGLQNQFHVYAIDLLGYGRSDRPERGYIAEDYVNLIGQTLQQLGEGTALIASSLCAAYAIKAAVRWPALVRSLILVCPVGIKQLATPPGPRNWAVFTTMRGFLGDTLFKGLTTRPSMRLFLERQAYANPASVTPDTLDGFYQTTRQPGAKYAPLSFVTGLLNCNITTEFAQLVQPVLMVWGREATTTPLSQSQAFLTRNPKANLAVVENASLLVQDEQPDRFIELVTDFLS